MERRPPSVNLLDRCYSGSVRNQSVSFGRGCKTSALHYNLTAQTLGHSRSYCACGLSGGTILLGPASVGFIVQVELPAEQNKSLRMSVMRCPRPGCGVGGAGAALVGERGAQGQDWGRDEDGGNRGSSVGPVWGRRERGSKAASPSRV